MSNQQTEEIVKCPFHEPPKDKPISIGRDRLFYLKEEIRTDWKGRLIEFETLNYKNKNWFFKPDLHGFYNANELLPVDCDLVQVKTEKGIYPGWWTGTDWYCRQKLKDDPIIGWRKHYLPEDFVIDEED